LDNLYSFVEGEMREMDSIEKILPEDDSDFASRVVHINFMLAKSYSQLRSQ